MLLIYLIFSLFFTSASSLDPPYGSLQINGVYLTDSHGTPVQLRGMSLFDSQWTTIFWDHKTIEGVKCYWNSNVVRAAMGITPNGYLYYPEREYEKVKTAIEAAIDLGIYVLVDWHDFNASYHRDAAVGFFKNISTVYGSYPHVIYEIWNEPVTGNWTVIKEYAEVVIAAIRENDPDNVIVVGTPWWSGLPSLVGDPLNGYAHTGQLTLSSWH